jgi:hypothetical protein
MECNTPVGVILFQHTCMSIFYSVFGVQQEYCSWVGCTSKQAMKLSSYVLGSAQMTKKLRQKYMVWHTRHKSLINKSEFRDQTDQQPFHKQNMGSKWPEGANSHQGIMRDGWLIDSQHFSIGFQFSIQPEWLNLVPL